jgi:hypothetical protein
MSLQNWLEKLRADLIAIDGRFVELEEEVIASSIVAVQQYWPRATLQQYFYRYTLPILERSGVLASRDHQLKVMVGSAQLSMGLHLLALDDVLDQDGQKDSCPELLRIAQAHLAAAMGHLHSLGISWGLDQQAIYEQFLDYESELRAGIVHDLGALWRRASPLCVVPESVLPVIGFQRSLGSIFRQYLGWTLLHSDCCDLLKDLRTGQVTPATTLVRDCEQGDRHDVIRCGTALDHIRRVLDHQRRVIMQALNQPSDTVWICAIDNLEALFSSQAS